MQIFDHTKSKHFCLNYKGLLDDTARWLEKQHMLNEDMWRLFVNQYRLRPDGETNAWRGEYWGKMMRGAVVLYIYTRNDELYRVITDTVEDMLSTQDSLGRFSTYEIEKEFGNWDLWCRKYVMLGFQYYLEICKDAELKKRIVKAVSAHADYIIEKIGPSKEGKREINDSGFEFLKGLNASSILEPMVIQYTLTQNSIYLEFAEYIVKSGGTRDENIFQLALEGKKFPYEYQVTKAYEMMSFFEGLLALYRVTNNEDYFNAARNFTDLIAQSDITVIGGSGCHHEFFDNSTKAQTDPTIQLLKNETCVTVTWMKLCLQMLHLTGDTKYADYIELSGYNALQGAINTKECLYDFVAHEDYKGIFDYNDIQNGINDFGLPFDSYSPLLPGIRGDGIGGFQKMQGDTYYGCCACIGGVGVGLFMDSVVIYADDGFAVPFYFPGKVQLATKEGEKVSFRIHTQYPISGKVEFIIDETPDTEYSLNFRIPEWSKYSVAKLNGEDVEALPRQYLKITRRWKKGDKVILDFDMPTYVMHQDGYVSLKRGPIVLAGDEMFGNNLEDAVSLNENSDGTVDVTVVENSYFDSSLCVTVPMTNKTEILMCDYASAGKQWNNKKRIAAWLPSI